MRHLSSIFFFFNDTATTEIYTLSLHDALPIFHHRLHTVLLNRADLHADSTAQVARHDRAAALEDQLVLFDASVPDLLGHQGTAGTALHADLADLAEFVDAIVNRLVVGHLRVGEDDLEPSPGSEVRREQLSVGAELTQAGLHEHGDHRAVVPGGA